MDIPGIQKLPPKQAFAKRGMSKLTAEEKVTLTSMTRMGLVYSMIHKEGTGSRGFLNIHYFHVRIMYIYIHCICT